MLVYQTEQQVYQAAKEAASKVVPVPVGDPKNFYVHTRTTAAGTVFKVLSTKEEVFTSGTAFVNGGKCWAYYAITMMSPDAPATIYSVSIIDGVLVGCNIELEMGFLGDTLEDLDAAEETVIALNAEEN